MSPRRKRLRVSDEGLPSLDNGQDVQQLETKLGVADSKIQPTTTSRSLFVRSLPASTTTENLVELFSQSYPIKHATAVVDRATRTCKGYGFVTFAESEDAQKALEEFNGADFGGRTIKVEIAESRHREAVDTVPGQDRPKNAPSAAAIEAKAKRELERKERRPPKLIIRNLPWSIKNPDQLAALFRSYGKVKHATLPGKKPGLLTGFGFVVLRGEKNAEKAIQGVNGKELDGRTLAVDWAVEKDVWQGQQQEIDGAMKEEGEIQSQKPVQDHLSEDDEEQDAMLEYSDDEMFEEGASDEDSMSDPVDDMESGSPPLEDSDKTSFTIFIRNLPFTASDDGLFEHFKQFGSVRYARIVLDPTTERPKGTGFVCFFKQEDAQECLRNAPNALLSQRDQKPKKSGATVVAAHSVLQNDNIDASGKYTMEGRVLQVSQAVNKADAAKLTEAGHVHRNGRDRDKRRLYLLSEGTVSSHSPLYQMLSLSEIAMREASAKQRKNLIQSNPSLHLSLTRLSVRNVPRSITSKDLKALARVAVVGFAKDVKTGSRQRLSKEELMRGGEEMEKAEKRRKLKGVGIVKQAKIVYEGREGGKVSEDTGAGRSRGYGFIEYFSHRSALMGLRWLNGHPIGTPEREIENGRSIKSGPKERKKRLIVEFAIENAQVVKRRSERENHSRDIPKTAEQDGLKRNFTTNGRKSNDHSNAHDAPKSAAGKKRKNQDDANRIDAPSKNDEKLAKRQRIIAKKRLIRRTRRKEQKSH